MTHRSYRATIERDENAPRRARDLVTSWVVDLPTNVGENAQLLVSEIVTNAVVHQEDGHDIEMAADIGPDKLRVAVTSHGAALYDRDRTTGWGLTIVDLIADAWSIESLDPTIVWFELSRR